MVQFMPRTMMRWAGNRSQEGGLIFLLGWTRPVSMERPMLLSAGEVKGWVAIFGQGSAFTISASPTCDVIHVVEESCKRGQSSQ